MKPNVNDPNHSKLVEWVKKHFENVIDRAYVIDSMQELKYVNCITSMLNRTSSDLIAIRTKTETKTDNDLMFPNEIKYAIEIECKTSKKDSGFNIEALPLIEQILKHKRYNSYCFIYVLWRISSGAIYSFGQDKVPEPTTLVLFKDKNYPEKDAIKRLCKEQWPNITISEDNEMTSNASGDPFLAFNSDDELDKFKKKNILK